jgi:hydroxyacylglutathione hydrolase
VYGHVSDKGRIPGMTQNLEEGDLVRIGRLVGRVLFVPGHTRGHIAYLFDGVMFCGDTVFVGGCGRLFEGTPQQMYHSLNVKIANLPDETRLYCAHEYTEKNLSFALTLEPGNRALQEKMRKVKDARLHGESTVPSSLGEEKSYNPFFRCDSPEIYENLKKLSPIPKDPVSVFTKVRELKDRF